MKHDTVGWLQWLRTLRWTWWPWASRSTKQDPLEELRRLLFADEALESVGGYAAARPRGRADDSWSFFARASERVCEGRPRLARQELHGLLELEGLDARSRLLAWHCLRQLGEAPSREEAGRVLGIIVESDSPQGPEILAAYADGTARLLPPGGAFLMFERPSPRQHRVILGFLRTGRSLVQARRPLRGPRPAPPSGTWCRVSVLTPAGHRLQVGERLALLRDRRVGPILSEAESLARGLNAELELAAGGWEEETASGTLDGEDTGTGGPVIH
jgi:hypothetical protein